MLTILTGDALTKLRELPDESVQCCVTSPPYWGLRDYGTASWEGGSTDCQHEGDQRYYTEQTAAVSSSDAFSEPGQSNIDRLKEGRWRNNGTCVKCGAVKRDSQLGLEKTPEEYVAKMVEVFHEVRRVLRKDGTLWLNLGDSYASASACDRRNVVGNGSPDENCVRPNRLSGTLKEKDLCGIPWRVAFALQSDGWFLRQDIIWAKPNPMPESVTDRCTKAHEYLFLLTKSATYYYDQDAIKQPCLESSVTRLGQDVDNQLGSDRVPGKTNGRMKAVKFGGNNLCPDTRLQSGNEWKPKTCGQNSRMFQDRDPNHSTDRKHRDPIMGGGGTGFVGHSGNQKADGTVYILANKKSVWTVPTQPFKEAHFATYPPDLIKPCIMAGTRAGDTVLDPFAGSGTTGMVSLELGRQAILIELNPKYVELIEQRCDVTPGLPL